VRVFVPTTLEPGNLTFNVAYNPPGSRNDVVLTVIEGGAVPQPASLVMLSIGLGATGALVASRGRKARS
jgi:hypothetical protein